MGDREYEPPKLRNLGTIEEVASSGFCEIPHEHDVEATEDPSSIADQQSDGEAPTPVVVENPSTFTIDRPRRAWVYDPASFEKDETDELAVQHPKELVVESPPMLRVDAPSEARVETPEATVGKPTPQPERSMVMEFEAPTQMTIHDPEELIFPRVAVKPTPTASKIDTEAQTQSD